MTTDRSAFFADLDEIIADPLYIGSGVDDLKQELAVNTWAISISQEQSQWLTAADIRAFIGKLINARQQQIDAKPKDHGMFFYLWFDEQACQLRFSLISDSNSALPFKTTLNLVDEPNQIIDAFLSDKYHDGIPWSDFTVSDFDPAVELDSGKTDSYRIDHPLNVYTVHLKPWAKLSNKTEQLR